MSYNQVSYNVYVDSRFRDYSSYPNCTDFGIRFDKPSNIDPLKQYLGQPIQDENYLECSIDPDFDNNDLSIDNVVISNYKLVNNYIYIVGTWNSSNNLVIKYKGDIVYTIESNTENQSTTPFLLQMNMEYTLNWIIVGSENSTIRCNVQIGQLGGIFFMFDYVDDIDLYLYTQNTNKLIYTVPNTTVYKSLSLCVIAVDIYGQPYVQDRTNWGVQLIGSMFDMTSTKENGKNQLLLDSVENMVISTNTNPYSLYGTNAFNYFSNNNFSPSPVPYPQGSFYTTGPDDDTTTVIITLNDRFRTNAPGHRNGILFIDISSKGIGFSNLVRRTFTTDVNTFFAGHFYANIDGEIFYTGIPGEFPVSSNVYPIYIYKLDLVTKRISLVAQSPARFNWTYHSGVVVYNNWYIFAHDKSNILYGYRFDKSTNTIVELASTVIPKPPDQSDSGNTMTYYINSKVYVIAVDIKINVISDDFVKNWSCIIYEFDIGTSTFIQRGVFYTYGETLFTQIFYLNDRAYGMINCRSPSILQIIDITDANNPIEISNINTNPECIPSVIQVNQEGTIHSYLSLGASTQFTQVIYNIDDPMNPYKLGDGYVINDVFSCTCVTPQNMMVGVFGNYGPSYRAFISRSPFLTMPNTITSTRIIKNSQNLLGESYVDGDCIDGYSFFVNNTNLEIYNSQRLNSVYQVLSTGSLSNKVTCFSNLSTIYVCTWNTTSSIIYLFNKNIELLQQLCIIESVVGFYYINIIKVNNIDYIISIDNNGILSIYNINGIIISSTVLYNIATYPNKQSIRIEYNLNIPYIIYQVSDADYIYSNSLLLSIDCSNVITPIVNTVINGGLYDGYYTVKNWGFLKTSDNKILNASRFYNESDILNNIFVYEWGQAPTEVQYRSFFIGGDVFNNQAIVGWTDDISKKSYFAFNHCSDNSGTFDYIEIVDTTNPKNIEYVATNTIKTTSHIKKLLIYKYDGRVILVSICENNIYYYDVSVPEFAAEYQEEKSISSSIDVQGSQSSSIIKINRLGNTEWFSNVGSNLLETIGHSYNICNIEYDNKFDLYVAGGFSKVINMFNPDSTIVNIITAEDNSYQSWIGKLSILTGEWAWVVSILGKEGDSYIEHISHNSINDSIAATIFNQCSTIIIYEPVQSSNLYNSNIVQKTLNNTSSTTSHICDFNKNGYINWSSTLYSKEISKYIELHDIYTHNNIYYVIGKTNSSIVNCSNSSNIDIQKLYTNLITTNDEAIIIYSFTSDGEYIKSNWIVSNMFDFTNYDIKYYSNNNSVIIPTNLYNSYSLDPYLTYYNKDGSSINKNNNINTQQTSFITLYKNDSTIQTYNNKSYSSVLINNYNYIETGANTIVGYNFYIQGDNNDTILNNNFTIRQVIVEDDTTRFIFDKQLSIDSIIRNQPLFKGNFSKTQTFSLCKTISINNISPLSITIELPSNINITQKDIIDGISLVDIQEDWIYNKIISFTKIQNNYIFILENNTITYTINSTILLLKNNKNYNYTLQFFPNLTPYDIYYNISLSSFSLPGKPIINSLLPGVRYIDDYPYVYLAIYNANDNDNYDDKILNLVYDNNIYRDKVAVFQLPVFGGGDSKFSSLSSSNNPRIKFTPGYTTLRFKLYDPDGNIILFDRSVADSTTDVVEERFMNTIFSLLFSRS